MLEKSTTNISALNAFSPLTRLSDVLLVLHDGILRNGRGSSQPSLLISLEKHFSRLGINLSQS